MKQFLHNQRQMKQFDQLNEATTAEDLQVLLQHDGVSSYIQNDNIVVISVATAQKARSISLSFQAFTSFKVLYGLPTVAEDWITEHFGWYVHWQTQVTNQS